MSSAQTSKLVEANRPDAGLYAYSVERWADVEALITDKKRWRKGVDALKAVFDAFKVYGHCDRDVRKCWILKPSDAPEVRSEAAAKCRADFCAATPPCEDDRLLGPGPPDFQKQCKKDGLKMYEYNTPAGDAAHRTSKANQVLPSRRKVI